MKTAVFSQLGNAYFYLKQYENARGKIFQNLYYRLYIGTAPWEINFAYVLVSRTTFYALSDGKKIQKCLKSAKIWAKHLDSSQKIK